jgi:hypothetical protein
MAIHKCLPYLDIWIDLEELAVAHGGDIVSAMLARKVVSRDGGKFILAV